MGPRHRRLATSLRYRATALAALGRTREAVAALDEAIEILGPLSPPDPAALEAARKLRADLSVGL
jgi:hypothetical protein